MASNSTRSVKATSTPLLIRFYDPTVRAADARGRTLDDILARSDAWFERCHDYVQMLFPLPEGSMFNYAAPVIDREVREAFRAKEELRESLRRAWGRMMEFYGFEVIEVPRTAETEDSTESAAPRDDRSASSDKTVKDASVKAQASVEGNASPGDNFQTPAPQQPSPPSSSPDSSASTSLSQRIRLERTSDHEQLFRNWVMKFNHNHLRITRILRSLRVLGLEAEAHAFLKALQDVQEDYQRFSPTSLMYWHRALERPLWIAPDGEEVDWLRDAKE